MSITFQTFGDDAILISWLPEINARTSNDIYLFNQKLQKLIPKFILETVTAYCSLTVFVAATIDKKTLISKLKDLYHADIDVQIKATTWQIPVCYDLSFAIDLGNLAKQKKVSIDEVIKLHSQVEYTVDFLGFLPGFPYLSGLNQRLHTPRLTTPRAKIAKGSVAIGGQQTGIYPIASPGGWHIIGRTKLNFFDVCQDQPCFIKPMDMIQFIPISLAEFKHD